MIKKIVIVVIVSILAWSTMYLNSKETTICDKNICYICGSLELYPSKKISFISFKNEKVDISTKSFLKCTQCGSFTDIEYKNDK
jgi:hypothetical protein